MTHVPEWKRRALTAGLLLLVVTALPSNLTAQEETAPGSDRSLERIRLSAGVGNALGGIGLQGEAFVLGSRLSVVGAVGRMFDLGGLNLAGALRGYLVARADHGGFVSIGTSPLEAVQLCLTSAGPGTCGPEVVARGVGTSGGYRFDTDFGVSVDGLLGIGWVTSVEPFHGIETGDTYPVYGVTVGYAF